MNNSCLEPLLSLLFKRYKIMFPFSFYIRKCIYLVTEHLLQQGVPPPRPRTGPGPWPVRNQAAQQEVSGR